MSGVSWAWLAWLSFSELRFTNVGNLNFFKNTKNLFAKTLDPLYNSSET